MPRQRHWNDRSSADAAQIFQIRTRGGRFASTPGYLLLPLRGKYQRLLLTAKKGLIPSFETPGAPV